MQFKVLLFSILLIIGTMGASCETAIPTPLLFKQMVKLNGETVQLYVDCSEGANYVEIKESCDPELLGTRVVELRDLSQEFISADIKQPQGYDTYLATTMMYFRIGQRNLNEYTIAEQIARQFFEIQKSHSGHSIDTARFYWAWFAAATASKQYFEDKLSLTPDRKADLLLALGEGTSILTTEEGPRLIRLQQALVALKFVIDSIPETEIGGG
jgi:hypothetical protein